MTDSNPDNRMVIFQADLGPRQTLDVEWVPDAVWDAHWAIVFTGQNCRQELRRVASYTEAKNAASAMAERVRSRLEVSA
jgi:hypothetical protein